MEYVDKTYYDETYEGESLTDVEFPKFNKRSQDIVDSLTTFDISTIDVKSPGLEIGNPHSIISICNNSRALANSIFSTVFN